MFINRKNRPPEFVLVRATEAGDEFYVEARSIAGGKVQAFWTPTSDLATHYSSKFAAKQARTRDGIIDCVPVKLS